MYFISAQYKEDLGDYEGAQLDTAYYNDAVAVAIKADTEAEMGDTDYRMQRNDERMGKFNFQPNEGSLS